MPPVNSREINFAQAASRRLFAPGAIPRRANVEAVTPGSTEEPPDVVGSAAADMPLPAIALFDGWSKHKRRSFQWSEMPSRVEHFHDVRRVDETNTGRSRRAFIQHHQGDFQVPEGVGTDRLFVRSEPEAVMVVVLSRFAIEMLGRDDDVFNLIFDMRLRFPMRRYANNDGSGSGKHQQRAQDRFFWLVLQELGRIVAWRDAHVLANHSILVDFTKPSVTDWSSDGLNLAIGDMPATPSVLSNTSTNVPLGLSCPEPVSLIHLIEAFRGAKRVTPRDSSSSARKTQQLRRFERVF